MLRLDDAPIGTIAPSIIGGHWEKTVHGWKANGGDTFPTPGGDWNGKLIPPTSAPAECIECGIATVPVIEIGAEFAGWICPGCYARLQKTT